MTTNMTTEELFEGLRMEAMGDPLWQLVPYLDIETVMDEIAAEDNNSLLRAAIHRGHCKIVRALLTFPTVVQNVDTPAVWQALEYFKEHGKEQYQLSSQLTAQESHEDCYQLMKTYLVEAKLRHEANLKAAFKWKVLMQVVAIGAIAAVVVAIAVSWPLALVTVGVAVFVGVLAGFGIFSSPAKEEDRKPVIFEEASEYNS